MCKVNVQERKPNVRIQTCMINKFVGCRTKSVVDRSIFEVFHRGFGMLF